MARTKDTHIGHRRGVGTDGGPVRQTGLPRSARKKSKSSIPDDLIVLELHNSSTERSPFERMASERFNALALWGMPEEFRSAFALVSAWSAENERLLAAVVQRQPPQNQDEPAVVWHTRPQFYCSVFARDSHYRYRPLANFGPLFTARAAEDTLQSRKGASGVLPLSLDQGTEPPLGMDLFTALPRVTKINPAYRILRDGARQAAAKRMMSEVARWLPDRDGNFVRDFQTTGFSARIWELYLYAAMRAMNFSVDLKHSVPDLCLSKGGKRVFVEAVTVNSPDSMTSAMKIGGWELPPEGSEFWRFIENEMPIKFGSPLFSKMQKRYWELNHVRAHPFVLAIADFHAPASMIWTHTAMPIYLFGRGVTVRIDEQGRKTGSEKFINTFYGTKKTIAEPFFDQPDTENVSAILFSNAGTMSKFNRMGVKAGFGDRFVKLVREGGLNDPHPGAFDPVLFCEDVEGSSYKEDWADELEMYHNPKALIPVDKSMFPDITHHQIENNEGIWRGPSPRVLFSWTHTIDFLNRPVPGFPKRRKIKPSKKLS